MKNNKQIHNFRSFEFGLTKDRWVYQGGPETRTEAPDIQKGGQKKEKPVSIDDQYLNKKFEAATQFLKDQVDESDKKQKELKEHLTDKITQEFKELEKEFKDKIKELGKEDADAQFREKWNKQADEKAQTWEHRILAAKIDSAEPGDQEKTKSLKINLIAHYLDSQGFGNSKEASKEFAKYLLDAGALPSGIQAEKFDDQMKANLSPDKVQLAVKKMSEEIRKLSMGSPEEKSHIEDLLAQNKDMQDTIGSKNFPNAVPILQKEFHIVFQEDGKTPLFAKRMDDDKLIPPDQIGNEMLKFSKVYLSSSKAIEQTRENTDKRVENAQKISNKVEKGVSIFNIGKVGDMDKAMASEDLAIVLRDLNQMNALRARALQQEAAAKATPAERKTEPPVEPGRTAEVSSPARETETKRSTELRGTEKLKPEAAKAKEVWMREMAKDERFQAILKIPGAQQEFDAELNFTLNLLAPADLAKIEKGEMKESVLSPESRKNFADAIRNKIGYPNLADKDDSEIKILNETVLDGKKMEEIFGGKTDMAEMLSRKYEIKKDEKTQGLLIDNMPIATQAALMDKMPKGIKEEFEKMGKAENKDKEEAKKQFNLRVQGENAGMQLAQQLVSKVENPALGGKEAEKKDSKEAKKGSEKMGTFETLGAFLQLWPIMKEAMNCNDWKTLSDAFEDFPESGKKMKESQDVYKKLLEGEKGKKASVNDLVSAYLNPRGTEANQLMGEKNNRYRSAIRPLIAKQIEAGLGVGSIGRIEQDGDRMILYTSKNGKDVAIQLFKDGGNWKLETSGYETKDVTEKGKVIGKEYKRNAASGNLKDLGTTIAMADLKDRLEGRQAEPTQKEADKAKEDLIQATDKLKPDERMAAIKAAGKYEAFQEEFKAANKKGEIKNSEQWEMNWIVGNKIPKPTQVAEIGE